MIIERTIRITSFALIIFVSGPASAQVVPAIDHGPGHEFFSVPYDGQGGQKMYYEACNGPGEPPSTFFWSTAGFGVSAWRPLNGGNCVYKRIWTRDMNIDILQGEVEFYGRNLSPVATWSFIWDDNRALARLTRWVSQFSARMEGPEGRASIEEIETMVGKSEAGALRISISASDAFSDVVFVLPGSEIEPSQLRERIARIDGKATVEVSEAASIGQPVMIDGAEPALREVQEGMIAILLKDADGLAISSEFEIAGLESLGRSAWVFGAIEGRVAIHDEVPLPQAAQ